MSQTQTETRKQAQNSSAPKTLEEHLVWIAGLADRGVDLQPLAVGLLREKFALQENLATVREHQEELRDQIESLCSPEQYPAVITGIRRNGSLSVEVYGAQMHLQVAVHPDVNPDDLRVGAQGILAKGRNCLVKVVDGIAHTWQEVGTFEGYIDDGERMLVRYQEQLVAVTPAHELAEQQLRKGDLVGFNREGARLAYTKVDPPGKEDLFFEETPSDRFEELGGLEREIALLKRMVRFRLQHPELAERYRLPVKRGILLEGPPGNGKTKLARCMARFIADLVPMGECRFMAIAGSSDYSMWLGQSEQRIIARFEAARELATRTQVPVLMFFDEIDAIGRRRGSDFGSSAPDRILNTFLAQLDGVQKISNLMVVAATNRADILDPGLLRPGRLGDVKIRIPAPNRQGARAILTRYLGDGIPLVGEVNCLVEALLGRLYSPRSDYAELARVSLRDGRKLAVAGRDLVSGAMLENVVRVAAEEAADRDARTGKVGITEADLVAAVEHELRSAAGMLTPQNVRSYVPRLPQEVDPVAVEPLHRATASTVYVRSA